MKIELLYIMDCSWCVKTKKLITESLQDLGVDADVEEILIDSEEKAKKYGFVGSPTIRINGEDIQEKLKKEECASCEELAEQGETTEFAEQECECGCRVYFYEGEEYSYPPKAMIEDAIKRCS